MFKKLMRRVVRHHLIQIKKIRLSLNSAVVYQSLSEYTWLASASIFLLQMVSGQRMFIGKTRVARNTIKSRLQFKQL